MEKLEKEKGGAKKNVIYNDKQWQKLKRENDAQFQVRCDI